ncbi:MAG: histidine phosphatase family protein [Friedmanniella sp.]|jgi:broad specificity phosphatase PhoE
MAVAELVVIRHGESLGNAAAAEAYAADAEVISVDRRDADVHLSPTGVDQAQALARGLKPLLTDDVPTTVWSSTYVRAQQTAEISLAGAGADLPVLLDERLRDRELGVLDMLTWKGVLNRFPLEAERRQWLGKFYHRPPGGESWADVVLRVRSFLLDLNAAPEGTRAIVFCHDALVLTFRYICEGLTERQILDIGAETPVKNVSITHLGRGADGRWQLRLFNDVGHLEESPAPVTDHPGEGNVHPQS